MVDSAYPCPSYFAESKRNQAKILAEIEFIPEQIAKATHAHASRFLEKIGKKFDLDCRAGCAPCCYQPATVFAFEAIQIAAMLRSTRSKSELEAIQAKMKDRVLGFCDASVKKNINNKSPCPLLITIGSGEQCSIYENRPLTCRMAHSYSV